MKKIEEKQFTTGLISHNKSKLIFLKEEKKKSIKNNTTLKAVAKTVSLSISHPACNVAATSHFVLI